MIEEITTLRKLNLIQTGPSPWSSPSFPVNKPRSTELRLVLDYRFLNAQTVRDSYPLPNLQDVIATLGDHRVYNKYDLKSGFW